jgi:hypothetical protein
MTPLQTFGAAQAPSNMMFPTAAYLQSSQNAAETRARGMEALGQGIAGGISAAAGAYKEYKNDQAKFDATKKMYSAFKSFLPEESQKEIEDMFSDTDMSVRQKNQISPLIMSMIAQGQQQAGKESVANIMAGNRLDVAALKNPPPAPRPAFNVAQSEDPLDQPVGQAPAAPAAPYMIQRPQPQPVQQQGRGKLPLTRYNERTQQYEFLDPRGTRYVPMGADFGLIP